jgi:hypothetical protein
MLRVAYCVADRIRFAVAQVTEWQRIADQINAAMREFALARCYFDYCQSHSEC